MHLIGLLRRKPELLQWQLDPSRMDVMRVKVDDDQYDISQILGMLAIAKQLVVIDTMKLQAPIVLKGRVIATDSVDQGDQVVQALGFGQLPLLDLVFLGIEVLFTPGLPRAIFAEFKRRSVDAIVCAESGGQEEPCHEGGPAAMLKILGQDVRRVRP